MSVGEKHWSGFSFQNLDFTLDTTYASKPVDQRKAGCDVCVALWIVNPFSQYWADFMQNLVFKFFLII